MPRPPLAQASRSAASTLRDLLTRGELDAAAALLLQADHELAPQDREAIASARAVPVEITGWDRVESFLRAAEARGVTVTALGVDLSAHGSPGSGGGPAIEVNAYTDAAFAFSTSTAEEIRAEMTDAGGPEWQGSFEDITSEALAVSGLGPLHDFIGALRDRGEEHSRTAEVVEGWRRVRFEGCLRAELEAGALRRDLPVVIGTNDLAPFLETLWIRLRRNPTSRALRGATSAALGGNGFASAGPAMLCLGRNQRGRRRWGCLGLGDCSSGRGIRRG